MSVEILIPVIFLSFAILGVGVVHIAHKIRERKKEKNLKKYRIINTK